MNKSELINKKLRRKSSFVDLAKIRYNYNNEEATRETVLSHSIHLNETKSEDQIHFDKLRKL